MVIANLKFFIGGGGYFGVNFGHLKSEVFHWGGGGALWSEIPERGFLENLDKNLLFEVNCTETCLCITDSLSHTTYVETKKLLISSQRNPHISRKWGCQILRHAFHLRHTSCFYSFLIPVLRRSKYIVSEIRLENRLDWKLD